MLSARFAVSEPIFWIRNPNDANARVKQTELDGKVILALLSLFGDVIHRQVMVLPLPFLHVGLACMILHHRKHLQQLRTDKSAVRKTAIYTSREFLALDEHIVVRYL